MNNGILYTLGLCCVWPLIVHLALTYGMSYLTTHDLKNIQWQNFKFPWSKDE